MSELPNGWATSTIGEWCVNLDSKRSPINSDERKERLNGKKDHELYPYYGATGQVGRIDGYLFDGEYVLIGEDGAPFMDPYKDKAYMVSGRFWVNNHAHILEPHANPKFTCYYLNQFRYADHVTGTTRLKLTKAALEQMPIVIPPLAEQRRIVGKVEELFSELDEGVANLKQARAQLAVYRQALLKHAFEGHLTADWRKQHASELESADQLLARIRVQRESHYQKQMWDWEIASKAWDRNEASGKKPAKPFPPRPMEPLTSAELETLPKLPFGWTYLKIDDLCDVVRGGSPRPAGDPKYYEGSIPFLKVGDLTQKPGVYLDTYEHTIKEAGLHKTRLVQPPTLMISNSGATLGVPKICRIEATFNDGIAAFLGLEDSDQLYHYYFWEGKTQHLRGVDQGAAQPNLNTDLLRNYYIPICSKAEMVQVTDELDRQLSALANIEADIDLNLQKAEALRQSILKKAFAGELVPQDPADEPAATLLARIRAEREAQPVNRRTRR